MAVFIFRTISLFALALAFLASARAQQTCQLMLKETATTATEIELLENFLRVFRCDGVSNFKLSLTWSPRLTTVNCGIPRARMYFGKSPEELLQRWLSKSSPILCNPIARKGCQFPHSPFDATSYIGVPHEAVRYGSECHVTTEQKHLRLMVWSLAVGVVLVLFSAAMSRSFAFRIMAGGLFTAFSSLIILLFFMSRAFRGDRKNGVLAGLCSGFGVIGWWSLKQTTGSWLPPVAVLFYNPWLWGYLLFCGSIGAAIVYIQGGCMGNPRVATVLMIALRLLGLLLIYGGTWTNIHVSSVMLCLALLYWVAPSSFCFPCWLPSFKVSSSDGSTMRQQATTDDRCDDVVEAADKPLPPRKAHPLLRCGLILGPDMDIVQTDSQQYDDLINEGYRPDFWTGRLVPGCKAGGPEVD